MSSYCDKIDCNCKYCDEDEGCIFFSQGSGNEIDMPCYKEDTILALYKIQELCKEWDIHIEINRVCLTFKKYVEINGRQFRYNQAFSLFEIEKMYQDLDNCADEFITRLEKEKAKLKEGDTDAKLD